MVTIGRCRSAIDSHRNSSRDASSPPSARACRAPIAWSLIKGLDQTALSLFHLVEEADAGDLVGQEPIKITNDDDAAALYNKVVEAGKVLIRDYYPAFESGMVPRTPQDESQATWCRSVNPATA